MTHNVAACYDVASVALFTRPGRSATGEQMMVLTGQKGGVTQVLWSPDGNYLYTARPPSYCPPRQPAYVEPSLVS
jgi:hypothetical protein